MSTPISGQYYTIPLTPSPGTGINTIHVATSLEAYLAHHPNGFDRSQGTSHVEIPFGLDPFDLNERIIEQAELTGYDIAIIQTGNSGHVLNLLSSVRRKAEGFLYPGVGVGVVIEYGGNIPLTLRGGESNNRVGRWELPGGTLEVNTPLEVRGNAAHLFSAAKLEVRQELGLEIEPYKIVSIHEDLCEGQQWYSFGIAARYVSGTLANMEPHKFTQVNAFAPWSLPQPLSRLTQEVITAYQRGDTININSIKE